MLFFLGHGTLKKPWSITKMHDYFMTIKSAEPEMTPEAETIIRTYAKRNNFSHRILLTYLAIIQHLVESQKILIDT